MKKLHSLIKACMTSDMNMFKVQKAKNNKENVAIFVALALCFMFVGWSYASLLFENLAPVHLQYIVFSIFVFATSIITLIEGIYKSGPLLFNCKDDQLLLSLPIERKTILFVRILKFYIFELIFNSMFIIPLIISYLRWADSIDINFFITSIVMTLLLPIIPIVLSCIIGALITSISSRSKHKKLIQTIGSILFVLAVMYLSYNMDNFMTHLVERATSVNDLISKIYYPAGLYANLIVNFNVKDLLIFTLVNILLLGALIFVLSKVYFKINSRLKGVITSTKVDINTLKFKSNNVTKSLIKKELNTFFNTPVLIINSGFGLVLFLILVVMVSIKYSSFVSSISQIIGEDVSLSIITNNTSFIILALILFTTFMTSITNSVISLEGKGINILKSLPVEEKKILMSKVLYGLVLTTPVLLLGDLILFINFKTSFIQALLLIIISIVGPLLMHLFGVIINLKFPKLDADNSTEVVKQSASSFISVFTGMILMIGSIALLVELFDKMNPNLLLALYVFIFIVLDILLYIYLVKRSVKDFKDLTI